MAAVVEPPALSIDEQLKDLEVRFGEVAGQLEIAAQRLRRPGVPPDADVVEALQELSRAFDCLREAIEQQLSDGAWDLPELSSLSAISSAVARFSGDFTAKQNEALALLADLRGLSHGGKADWPPLTSSGDTSKAAIRGRVKTGHFGSRVAPETGVRFTSRPGAEASRSGAWSASCAART